MRGASVPTAWLLAAGLAVGSAEAAEARPSAGVVQSSVERALSETLHGEVRFGAFEVDWLRLEARFRDARADLVTRSGHRATARIEAGRMSLSWAAIPGFAAGTVRISALDLVRPRLIGSAAFAREWRPGSGRKGDLEIRLDRVAVTEGTIEWDAGPAVGRIAALAVGVAGTWSSSRKSLVGDFSTRATLTGGSFREPLELTARGGFVHRGSTLELHTVRVTAAGVTAEGRASATFSKGGASVLALAEGRADASRLRAWFVPGGPEVEGALRVSARIDREPPDPWRVTGTVRASDARVGPLRSPGLTAELALSAEGLAIREVRGTLLGGTVEGGGFVSRGAVRSFDATLRVEGADARLVSETAGRPLPVDARVDADVRLSIPLAEARAWTGRVDFAAVPVSRGTGVPVGGRGTLDFEAGRVRGTGLALEAPSLTGSIDLELPLRAGSEPGEFRFRTRTEDASKTQPAALRILRALGVGLPEWMDTSLSGRGRVDGGTTVGATRGWDLRMELEEGAWGDEPFDRAHLEAAGIGDVVDLSRLEVRRGAEVLQGSARFDTGPFRLLSARVLGASVRAGPLLARWARTEGIDGEASLDLLLDRVGGDLRGGGSFRLERGSLWGEPIDLVRGRVAVAGDRWELSDGAATGPSISAEAAGSYDAAGESASGTIRIHALRPEEVERLREGGLRLAGTVSGAGTWGWSRRGGPSADLALTAERLGLPGLLGPESLGAAEGRFALADGGIDLSLTQVPAAAWSIVANARTVEGLPFDASLVLDHFLVEPPDLAASGISADVSGTAHAKGDLARPATIEVEATGESVTVHVPGGRFESLRPVPLLLRDRHVTVGPASFGTKGANLDAAFEWDLADDRVQGRFQGRADLSLLSLLRKNVRGSGVLDLDVRLDGTMRSPSLDGRATVSGGRIRWTGLRQSLDEVDARIAFDGRRIRLEEFHAVTGGGELNGEGEWEIVPGGPARFEAMVAVSQVAVAFPEGFRGIYDGALHLEGTPVASTLSGRLSLLRGLYDADFEIGALGGATAREVEDPSLAGLPEGVALDVEIEGMDDIWLRNNFGRLEAGVSLRVGGEIRRPRVSGRIVMFEGGRLRFRDVDYRVVAGSLEFDGGERIDPFVELRGETRVRDYDVRLRIAGKLDSLEYELTSYPTLPESDIVYLLLTGDVPLSSTGSGGTGSESISGVAADYFAGVLTAGFSKQLEKSLRLDQFRINPLLESGADPTARITIGKEVTERMRISYSVDVGSVEDETYLVEWEASRRWRLTAEREVTSAYVGNIQYTDRYGRGGSEPERLPPDRSDSRAAETIAVAAIRVSGVGEEEARKLRKKVPFEPGDSIRRTDVFLAAEAIRKDLVARGWLDARVEFMVGNDTAGTSIEFRVEGGDPTELVIEGLGGRLERAVRRSLRELFLEGIPGPDRASEAAGVVLEELRLRGRYAADVSVREETGATGGRTLRIVADPGPEVRASEVRIEGASQIPEERVRKQILTGRSEGFSSRPISPAVLDEDARAILALYRSEGYLEAAVDPPDVRLSLTGETAEVRFVLREGDLARIEAIEVRVEGPVERGEIEAWSGLRVGEAASTGSLAAAARNVRARLDERGFPGARIDVRPYRDGEILSIRMHVVTGPRMHYAGTVITGNFRTRDKVILREVPFAFGEPISEARLRQFQHRLYRLGVFRDVRVTTEVEEGGAAGATRLRVAVQEAKPVSLGIGAGYDTEAGPRLVFAVGHDNVAGYNRSLTLQTRWSEIERRVQLVGRDPRLFNRQLDTTATYFWEETEEDGFEVSRNSFAIRTERRLPSEWKRFLRYNFQEVDITIFEVTDDLIDAIREQKLQDLRLGDVGLTFARDTRDDSFSPTRGGYALGEIRLFLPVLLSEESFAKLFLQGSTTHTFSRGLSYSGAVRIGASKTFGSTSTVPLAERFFAGGSATLRGFERDTVGLVVEDIPLGGEALLVINHELRWPLWKSLQLVVFTDWGNVYTELESFDPTDLRYTAGGGFRLNTPIGPLRFEYGHKLDRRAGESAGEYYFAVGTIY